MAVPRWAMVVLDAFLTSAPLDFTGVSVPQPVRERLTAAKQAKVLAGRPVGPSEAAYRRWVAQLGELSERQAAEAQQVYAVAAQLDKARDSGMTSATAALSRELRQLASALRDVQVPAAAPAVVEESVPVSVPDEVARRRAARRGSA